ncbi:hypothetical protein CW751_03620 [Brumimicrobium salinarum]|uniref:Thiol-disulfide oxidoreductase n=1 Tax=Brumimicrobium salinarum TaxID=2058658 RepID=A0A2I0R4W1_9FLAO|nr:DUF393 domain-containing protein [Brumimicrobium salinarum]PKR81624.1 hypothetical protein CW751_03620 [Brumimicrobium salinarum]
MKFKDIIKLKYIVFYDGDCGFCSSSVQLILKQKKTDFYFIALQSDLAKKIMDIHDEVIEMNTLYLLKDGSLYQKSEAALQISKKLKGLYPILYFIGKIVPLFLRDWIYDQIAKRRYKIISKFCVLPSEQEKQFFLYTADDSPKK